MSAEPVSGETMPRTADAVRRTGWRRLQDAGCRTAALESQVLLSHVTGWTREDLLRGPGDHLTTDQIGAYDRLIARRAAGEPLAFLTGRQAFWSLNLSVSAATLIPRADSETVIEAVLSETGPPDRPLHVLDLGTGTGCLLLALLSEWPTAIGTGIDRSAAAVALARQNARSHGLENRARFVCGSWFDPLAARFDVIVANPPYICREVIASLDRTVCDWEPDSALDGGPDGLDAYRVIVPALARALRPGGLAALETGFDQRGALDRLIGAEAGLGEPSWFRDLAGHDRCVTVRRAQ